MVLASFDLPNQNVCNMIGPEWFIRWVSHSCSAVVFPADCQMHASVADNIYSYGSM